MKTDELQQVRPGFFDAALGSQAVFRSALSALSHPGRVIEMPEVSELPRHGHGAAAVLLMALVDSECSVWLSPSLAHTDAAAWLRFHTGCQWASTPPAARFLWVAEGDELPPLSSLDAGSDEYPDQSATCVIEVSTLMSSPISAPDGSAMQPTLDLSLNLSLSGPGIASTQPLSVVGLPPDFATQWADNHQRFPRGVDLFLTTPTRLAGLPRTTRAHATNIPQEA